VILGSIDTTKRRAYTRGSRSLADPGNAEDLNRGQRCEPYLNRGSPDLELRKNSNDVLATVIWDNVDTNVFLTLLSGSVLAGLGAAFLLDGHDYVSCVTLYSINPTRFRACAGIGRSLYGTCRRGSAMSLGS
jgi:hypothetical protein